MHTYFNLSSEIQDFPIIVYNIKRTIYSTQLMDWVVCSTTDTQPYVSFLQKLDKLTMYDHNFHLTKNFQNLTFSCILNCKCLNKQYSIIGKIEGDLPNQSIQISCSLVNLQGIVMCQWQHQKIQLTKFAYRYNDKNIRFNAMKPAQQSNQYQIKVNPLSGQFYVSYNFLLGQDLLKDNEKFRAKITDQCQKIINQSQKIFNTIIEVIFDLQANQPFLKSDQRVGIHYPRLVKVGKLLRKIKKLSTLSSAYKIKHDIAVMNKYRSVFKKHYLKKQQKTIHNKEIIENALLMIPKFCKKHVDALPESALPNKKKNSMITSFEDLEDNHQILFAATHLQDFSKPRVGEPIIDITSAFSPQERLQLAKPGVYQIRDMLLRVQQYSRKQHKMYEYELLSRIPFKHQNITQYYHIKDAQFACLRITQYSSTQLPLQEYLNLHSSTISLTSRLQIMIQICNVMQIFHKHYIGYFLDWKNIYVNQKAIVKIRYFNSAYSVACWDQTKQKQRNNNKKFLMENYKEYTVVCGFDESKMEEEGANKEITKFENQRADVFMLGMVLYRVLIDKFPFSTNCISTLQSKKDISQFLHSIWTLETEYYLMHGGMVVKVLAHLLLKCFYMQVEKRPYVQWIKVILSQVKSSLQCLY